MREKNEIQFFNSIQKYNFHRDFVGHLRKNQLFEILFITKKIYKTKKSLICLFSLIKKDKKKKKKNKKKLYKLYLNIKKKII